MPTWFGHILAGVLSFLAAFYGVGVVLFSDVFGLGSHLGAIGYILVMYYILSLLLHWLWPNRGWTWFLWLVIPGALIGLFLALSDFGRVVYPLGVLAAMLLGSWLPHKQFTHPNKEVKGII